MTSAIDALVLKGPAALVACLDIDGAQPMKQTASAKATDIEQTARGEGEDMEQTTTGEGGDLKRTTPGEGDDEVEAELIAITIEDDKIDEGSAS